MASILEKYGIKEVAEITFYHINEEDHLPDYPVLYIDTAKVSTLEQTAEETEARGGKGNPVLMSWDYNKDITLTIEDALFSAKSMAIMFGNGTAKPYSGDNAYIMKTEQFKPKKLSKEDIPKSTDGKTGAEEGDGGWSNKFEGPDGKTYDKINPKFYDETGKPIANQTAWNKAVTDGQYLFCSYDLKVDGAVIEISGNTFPGTYYITGETFARSQATGNDEFFQFIVPRGKVQSENTLTMEAEGDPTVFNMSVRVLRPDDGKMMQLVKYNLVGGAEASDDSGLQAEIIHNHYLDTDNTSQLAAAG